MEDTDGGHRTITHRTNELRDLLDEAEFDDDTARITIDQVVINQQPGNGNGDSLMPISLSVSRSWKLWFLFALSVGGMIAGIIQGLR